MKSIGIAAVWMLASAGAAEAGEWRYATHGVGVVLGFDQSSMRVTGHLRTFWSIRVEESTTTVGQITFDYQLQRTLVDCDQGTKTVTTNAAYLIASDDPVLVFEDDTGPRNQLPDSIGSGLLLAACTEPLPDSSMGATAEEFALFARERLFPMFEQSDQP